MFDNGYKTTTNITVIKKGNIKNPYHKSVFGVGYFGVGDYKGGNEKCYRTWYNIFIRCYSEDYKIKRPTYKDATVCEEWHNFQNFAKWFEENYYEVGDEEMHLDKDILVKGNKVYSPETCVFVPQKINQLFVNRSRSSSLPRGVRKEWNRFKAEIKCNGNKTYLGMFSTKEEAFESYKNAKEKYIKEVAEMYNGIIPTKLYDALINYTIHIED